MQKIYSEEKIEKLRTGNKREKLELVQYYLNIAKDILNDAFDYVPGDYEHEKYGDILYKINLAMQPLGKEINSLYIDIKR